MGSRLNHRLVRAICAPAKISFKEAGRAGVHRSCPDGMMNRMTADDPNHERKPERRSPLHFLFRHPLSLETETSWFLLLGVMDLVLTTFLLNTGVVHEVNPLARFFIFAGGVHGLIYYKCALLAVAAVSAQVIVLRRPRAAKAVLHTGIGAQFAVVVYSVTLLLKVVV